jgi:hypothetical protein
MSNALLSTKLYFLPSRLSLPPRLHLVILSRAVDLRSVYLTMTDLVHRPEWLEELLEIAFARLQVQAGAGIIDLDWMVDMKSAAERFGERVSFCGNVDPVAVMLQGTPEKAYAATSGCMRIGGSRAISRAGCEIPDGTLEENFHARTRALQDVRGGYD